MFTWFITCQCCCGVLGQLEFSRDTIIVEFPKCEPFNWNFLNFQEKNQWNRNPCNPDCLSSKSLLLGHFLKFGPELLVKRSASLFYCFSFCREGRILSHSRPQCQFCSFDMRQEWWPWLTTRGRFHYGRSYQSERPGGIPEEYGTIFSDQTGPTNRNGFLPYFIPFRNSI